ncbi:NAD(P)H-hydrate dehydratase [Paenochrobactrum pullorum]|uniref:NAD(P)H-hydrate dehydratase n=1 Tax=Paenochrobactrum pullorum TaxID=1324351 RepID=UPI0035BBCF80
MENAFLNEPKLWKDALPRLAKDAHKYKRGHALIFSGNLTNTGAARLAAMSAARIGAGLVTVLSPSDALLVNAAHLTSIMLRETRTIQDALDYIEKRHVTAALIGPAYGLGVKTQHDCITLLNKASANRLVLDADAISSFENASDHLFKTIHASNIETVLTPHEGEFSRLFPDLSRDSKLTKAEKTLKAAARAGACVIYKGAQTIIAHPDGRYCYNENGTPLLATAGSGDVLAGMVTGLLAQNMSVFEATSAAVWLHCEAAKKFGAGLIAEELPLMLPQCLIALETS